MAQELVTRDRSRPPVEAGGSVAALIPQDLEQAFRLAGAIHASGLAPKEFNSAERILVAIMAGMELNLAPMQSLQAFAVINGRATLWGDGLLAVVRQSPACLWIREWLEGEGDHRVATCETHRKGEPEPVRRSFSVDDAKAAGLWNPKSNAPWGKYPQRMLQMRARAWCLRDVYADALSGVQIREEVEDYAPQEPAAPERVPLSQRLAAAPTVRDGEPAGFSDPFVEGELAEMAQDADDGDQPDTEALWLLHDEMLACEDLEQLELVRERAGDGDAQHQLGNFHDSRIERAAEEPFSEAAIIAGAERIIGAKRAPAA